MRCREWQGCRLPKGYGKRKVNGRSLLVHRWIWEQVNGPIPAGLKVLHTCDNPPCFLYEHLRLGTQSDNLADMKAKGRGTHFPRFRPSGEANGNSKLTAQQVVDIRSAIDTGEVQRRIAERYTVSPATITRIKKGEVW